LDLAAVAVNDTIRLGHAEEAPPAQGAGAAVTILGGRLR
jgi:hypothetical protein